MTCRRFFEDVRAGFLEEFCSCLEQGTSKEFRTALGI